MLHSFGLNFSQFCGSLAHLALLMYLPGSGTFSIQTLSRHVKNHPRTVEQLLQHHSTIETIRDCVTRICCRIAETAEGTVASVSSKQPPPSSLQPLRATAFVETRDFPSKLLRCATWELMNALVQVRDCNAVASTVSSGLTGMSSLKQSSPEAFYKSRVQEWELKRETHDTLIKLAKQREVEQEAEEPCSNARGAVHQRRPTTGGLTSTADAGAQLRNFDGQGVPCTDTDRCAARDARVVPLHGPKRGE